MKKNSPLMCQVNRDRVIRLALLFEKIPAWQRMGIKFNLGQANELPLDGVPEGLSVIVEDGESESAAAQDQGPVEDEENEEDTVVFVEHEGQVDQSALVHDSLWSQENREQNEPLPFPVRDETPINEFETNEIFSLVFPTLFPFGISSPCLTIRKRGPFKPCSS
jgi:hypothetical protein